MIISPLYTFGGFTLNRATLIIKPLIINLITMNTKTVVIWVIVLVVLGYAIYAFTRGNGGEEVVPQESAPLVDEAAPAAGEAVVE